MASLNYSYLYFDVRDYTNSTSLSSYTLDITPLTFIPDFNSSPLLSGSTVISNKKIQWNFGDGTYSNDLTATHRYTWPGTYEVKLTIFDSNGTSYDSSYKPIITIRDFIADDFLFQDYGKFIYDVPASKIIDPLTILRRNSWQTYNALSSIGYTVNLYASGAAGSFIDINAFNNDKWSHLRSLSRFYEKQTIGDTEEYVIVTAVSTNDTEIYARINNNTLQVCGKNDSGATFAGTSGYAEFYYVDDKTKNYTTRENPIFIFATLDNAKFKDYFSQQNNIFNYISYPPYGFQTIEPAVQPIIKVRHNPASRLSITSNGIDGEGALSATYFNIPSISWQNTQIPFVIKLKDTENFTTRTYPPLYCTTADSLALSSVSAFNLTIDLAYLSAGTYIRVPNINFISDFNSDIPRSVGAFYKGYFLSENSILNCVLTAGMTVVDPVNFPKDSLVGWICEPEFKYIKRILKTSFYNSCFGSVTVNLSAYVQDYETPNSPESYCIAMAPSGTGAGNDYLAWIGDGYAEKIYKIDIYGNILSAFSLSSYPLSTTSGIVNTNLTSPVLSSAAPNSIALDGYSDVWVSLFDSVSCIKLDYSSGVIKSVAYPNLQNIVYYLSSTYDLPELSGFAGENSLLPASIDTDKDNNLWVAYTHPVSNFLFKYTTTGTVITAVPFPSLISPVEIAVDRNNFVWFTALNNATNPPNILDRNDFVYKLDSTGALVSGFPLSGFKLVGNITIDGSQSAYVSHALETITKIDGITNAQTNFVAGAGNNDTNYICSIGGIAADTGNYIWTINNFDNKLYYIDSYQSSVTSVNGVDNIDLVFPADNDPLNPVSAFAEKIFQAYGDWNGSRWINKYMVPTTVTRFVSGESAVFNIYPDTGVYNIAKVNEDFNAKGFYDDLRYQEFLLDKTVFFDLFLGTIVGDLSSQPYELGKTIYEKIANFTDNISNIDKCNLDQLLSFCEELSVQFEQYNYPFPPQLRRLVDILSIKHKLLFGDQNKYNLNFDKKGYINPNYGKNLGSEISSVSGIIYSGVPIVAYEIFSGLYTLTNYSVISGTSYNSSLPLSTFNYNWGWGLVAPASLTGLDIGTFYKFYNFVDNYENSYYNNVINWNDPLNMLSPTMSSYKDWILNDGIMQNILSYELTKGLRLFTSAANIQYNN
jgi:hypothetical protein